MKNPLTNPFLGFDPLRYYELRLLCGASPTLGAVQTDHPFWKKGGRVIAPQRAFRSAGHHGYAPKSLSSADMDAIDAQIEKEFIGATLCGR